MTKIPPKRRKSYGKSLRRIAVKLGLKFVKVRQVTHE